jgi:hypothetical protein
MSHTTHGGLHGAGALLHTHHERLDRLFDQLLDAYAGGDWDDVRVVWTHFDRELAAHMALEETHLLPALAHVSAGEAAALRSEHDAIRKLVATLGVGVDLHVVKDDVVADLIAQLRDHAAREDLLAYHIADRELGRAALAELEHAQRMTDAETAATRQDPDAPKTAPTA